jgi:hypothetical protein
MVIVRTASDNIYQLLVLSIVYTFHAIFTASNDYFLKELTVDLCRVDGIRHVAIAILCSFKMDNQLFVLVNSGLRLKSEEF